MPLARPLLVLALAAAAAAGCAADRDTALAIDGARWVEPGVLAVTTECASAVRVEVDDDPAGTGLPRVTLRGVPETGRCTPRREVRLPADTTRLVDGTTSMVVDLPDPPA